MKRDYWPELWSLLGFAMMVWSLFRPETRQDVTFLAGLLGMIRGDVLAIAREQKAWRQL